jgi:YbbR domain-containing protein
MGDLGTAVLAVILSLIVWVNATYQTDRPRQDFFPELVPIEVVGLPEGLTITNDPVDLVRVEIIAFASSWSTLTVSNFRATVDLTNMTEGVRPVPIRVTCSDRTVTISRRQPETVYIGLEKVAKNAVEVKVEIADREELPLGYAIDPPEVEPQFVNVEGPASAVERVSSLVASVSVLGQRTAVEVQVEPRPLDADGKPVSGVKVLPPQVTVRFDIQKRLNYREVAVRALTKGNPARGYFVSSVDVEPSTVTVVGPPATIANMPGLVSTKTEVDVTGATRMIAERLELELPTGVSVLANNQEVQQQQVLVTVGVDPVIGGITVEVPLQTRKLSEGLSAKLSVPAVDVILRGPSILLDDLQVELLDAHVDLSGLGPGTHQVKTLVDILVDKNPKLGDLEVTSISPAYVEADIKLTEPTPEPSPSPLPTLTPMATITPTAAITPTVGLTGTRRPSATLTSTPSAK